MVNVSFQVGFSEGSSDFSFLDSDAYDGLETGMAYAKPLSGPDVAVGEWSGVQRKLA